MDSSSASFLHDSYTENYFANWKRNRQGFIIYSKDSAVLEKLSELQL